MGPKPTGTLWALVPCASAEPTDFGSFIEAFAQCMPPEMVGVPGCLQIVSDSLYFDIVFSHWTEGGNGGGFAYTRTPVPCDVLGSTCTAMPDSFVCACPPGYRTDSITGRCRDIDECALGFDGCHASAACENTGGSYRCVCSDFTFRKADYADPTLRENQDCITPNVCITRGNEAPLYNAVREDSADHSCSGPKPTDTEWALAPCDQAESWQFGPFIEDFAMCAPPYMLGRPGCLHLITDDLYFDIVFTEWTRYGDGGGFSYTRTQLAPPGVACP
jgi:hypothetical protein